MDLYDEIVANGPRGGDKSKPEKKTQVSQEVHEDILKKAYQKILEDTRVEREKSGRYQPLPKGIHDEILRRAKDQGHLSVEIATYLNISTDILRRWRKIDEELDQTLKTAHTYANSWWINKGRASLESQRFQCVVWGMIMKNTFGWGDKPSERPVEFEDWKGDLFQKIEIMDKMISEGKLCAEQYHHMMKSLDFHAKINEIIYIQPLISKLELERRFKEGEISETQYDEEKWILENGQVLRKVAAENLMKESKVVSKFQNKRSRKSKLEKDDKKRSKKIKYDDDDDKKGKKKASSKSRLEDDELEMMKEVERRMNKKLKKEK